MQNEHKDRLERLRTLLLRILAVLQQIPSLLNELGGGLEDARLDSISERMDSNTIEKKKTSVMHRKRQNRQAATCRARTHLDSTADILENPESRNQ